MKRFSQFTEAARYYTCPECEANFQLVDGKFPPHRAFRGTGRCEGSGTSPVNEGNEKPVWGVVGKMECPACDGKGYPDGTTKCATCDGKGLVVKPRKKLGEDIKPVIGGTLQTRVKHVNAYLSGTIGGKYWQSIPLQAIFDKCRNEGLNPVQEDGTDWEGFLLGRDGKTNIELRDLKGGPNRYLSLSYHKMDVTGNWEVVAYVS